MCQSPVNLSLPQSSLAPGIPWCPQGHPGTSPAGKEVEAQRRQAAGTGAGLRATAVGTQTGPSLCHRRRAWSLLGDRHLLHTWLGVGGLPPAEASLLAAHFTDEKMEVEQAKESSVTPRSRRSRIQSRAVWL